MICYFWPYIHKSIFILNLTFGFPDLKLETTGKITAEKKIIEEKWVYWIVAKMREEKMPEQENCCLEIWDFLNVYTLFSASHSGNCSIFRDDIGVWHTKLLHSDHTTQVFVADFSIFSKINATITIFQNIIFEIQVNGTNVVIIRIFYNLYISGENLNSIKCVLIIFDFLIP